ncbi:LuxR C-terminal-related transcriptional regulator [Leifsonia poae]|uniref:Helix-turn-helix transcriptional regulator n=1 Tax=Leifsonia poae TaxID=110933 RepID=A0A9W6HCM5_9MICO|nr:LuxR C-terminal-related transcriptional regulator [Leifsonia poae]GLJ78034.1 helix-turn-helix transcriptional regulator [Leifsonia poae]
MPGSAAVLNALADGRTAFAERRWEDAFGLLAIADQERRLGIGDLERYARSASLTARDDEAFALLERGYVQCLDEGDERRAANCAFWIGFRLSSLGERPRAEAWLWRASDLADRLGDCAVSGYVKIPQIHRELLKRRPDAAHLLAVEAAACGDRFGEADLSALARQLDGRALIELGQVDAGIRMLDEAMLVATTGPVSELGRGLVYCAVIGCCQRVLAVDRAREWSAVLDDWCRSQTQLGIFNGTCRVHRAELLEFGGDWPAALAEAGLVTSGMKVERRERAAATYEEAEIHRLRGERAEAQSLYESAAALGADPQPGLALLHLQYDDLEHAMGGIRRALGTSSSALGRVRFLPAFVEIALATGDRTDAGDATEAVDELERIAAAYDTPVLGALAVEARGRLLLASEQAGRIPHAVAALSTALEAWLELDAPYRAARVRVVLADGFDRLGDDEGAHLHRQAAAAVFAALGAAPGRERRTGDHADTASRGPLSDRELQVLRLATTGLTNKEIATELVLSRRTVDRHMSNILARLGVPSRAAATAYAYEHGLVAG